ncbi:MAG: sn-glycerol-1-phosphate dehydrogenase [Solobacterium sp.]|nr:sn-glycerol-1-phosphate dehydrogenase [Solobacterium sp.]
MNLNAYLNKRIPCSCGKEHFCAVKAVDIEEGALKRIPGYIKDYGFSNVYMIADPNTWKAAGEETARLLREAGIHFEVLVFEEEEPVPDERAIGRIFTTLPEGTDLLLGIGGGSINDLCKYVSYKLGLQCMLAATAPSMDGFVSEGAALILNHMKVTENAHSPVAVAGDLNVLTKAPMKLIAAGLGDTLGKYTCLLDWKIAHILNGEYYCRETAEMAETSLKAVRELALSGKVEQRDPEAIRSLTEALVMTGIAMAFAGNSRPASGCEHHMSHYWEMKAFLSGMFPALHGAQVGAGEVLTVKLYHMLAKEQPDFDALKERPFDKAAWEQMIRTNYTQAADGILALEEKAGKNDLSGRNRRLDAMKENWPEICRLIDTELPSADEMISLLKACDAPVSVKELGFPQAWVRETVLCAKEVRDRYTMLQMLWDLGLSEKYADYADEFEEELSRNI